MLKRTLFGLLLVLIVAPTAWAQAGPMQDPRAAAIVPYVHHATALVAHLDLRRVDLKAAADGFATLLPADAKDGVIQVAATATTIEFARQQLVEAGATDYYVFMDLEMGAAPVEFWLFPVATGKDPQEVIKVASSLPGISEQSFVHNGNVIFGKEGIKDYIDNTQAAGAERYEAAFKLAGQTDLQILIAPKPEFIGSIPAKEQDESSPFTSKQLAAAKNCQALVLTTNLPPKSALAMTLLAKDAAAATEAQAVVKDLLQSDPVKMYRANPATSGLLDLFTPKLEGDKLRIVLSGPNGGVKKLADNVKASLPLVKLAAEGGMLPLPDEVVSLLGSPNPQVAGIKSSNNLKTIALAIQNFHDTYGGFPPAYLPDAAGKPNLSWRVAILPFMEASNLYNEFHLDEPWDSEHNKKLIPLMPKTLQSPYARTEAGKTIYLGVTGERGIFVPPMGAGKTWKPATKFASVTDGTSNTAMVIEAAEESAVIWSKPDDGYAWDPKNPFHDLPKRDGNSFLVGLCDGSVKKFRHGMLPAQKWEFWLDKQDGMLVE